MLFDHHVGLEEMHLYFLANKNLQVARLMKLKIYGFVYFTWAVPGKSCRHPSQWVKNRLDLMFPFWIPEK